MLNIINKEIKELFKDKRIWTGLLIVLIIIIIGTSYNKKKHNLELPDLLRLGVINNDDSSYSNLLLSYFDNSETFSSLITVVVGEDYQIKDSFARRELDIYIEIPKGFAKNMIQIKHIPVKVVLNIEDTTKAILFQNVLQSYEKYISAVEVNAVGLYNIMKMDGMDQTVLDKSNMEVSMDLIFTALGKEAFFSYSHIDTFPSTKIKDYYLFSILIMTIFYIGLNAGFGVIRELSQGTFERIRTTKTTLLHFFLAKIAIITVAITIFTSVALCVITGKRFTIGAFSASFSATLFSVTFSLLLSLFFSTTQRFILVGNLLLFYCLVIGGGIIPIQYLPQNIVTLAKFTPNYYIMEGLIRFSKGQLDYSYKLHVVLYIISAASIIITILGYRRRRLVADEV